MNTGRISINYLHSREQKVDMSKILYTPGKKDEKIIPVNEDIKVNKKENIHG